MLHQKSRKWLKSAILNSGALRAAARFAGPRAAILMHHSVVEDPRDTANTIRISQSRASFERQMSTLATRFNPVSLDEVVSFVKDGHSLPRRSVVVTFDDGFADNHEFALPILQRYSIPATFYILVNAVDSGIPPWYSRLTYAFLSTQQAVWKDPQTGQAFQLGRETQRSAALSLVWDLGAALAGDAQEQFIAATHDSLQVEQLDARTRLMMDWNQVRALKQAGHTIGGHTLSHPNLAHIPREEARSEIQGCKRRLEEQLGEPLRHFSYPHPALDPQWSAATLELTRQAGFQSAVLTTPGLVRPGDEPLSLKRIPAAEDSDYLFWQLECTFAGF